MYVTVNKNLCKSLKLVCKQDCGAYNTRTITNTGLFNVLKANGIKMSKKLYLCRDLLYEKLKENILMFNGSGMVQM